MNELKIKFQLSVLKIVTEKMWEFKTVKNILLSCVVSQRELIGPSYCFAIFCMVGKHIGRLGHQDPGEFPEEVKALFEKAVEYYEENMVLMVEIQVSQALIRFFFQTTLNLRTEQHRVELVGILVMYIICWEISTRLYTTMRKG